MMYSNWLKLVTLLATSNQSNLFECRVVALRAVCNPITANRLGVGFELTFSNINDSIDDTNVLCDE